MNYLTQKMNTVRYEILFCALVMLLFNRIFITNENLYSQFVWPVNMLILGLSTFHLFKDQSFWFRLFKNLLLLISLAVPIWADYIFRHFESTLLAIFCFLIYYSIILFEVLRQITKRGEPTVSTIFGALSGYLLLIVVALFSFLIAATITPGSFHGMQANTIAGMYRELSYFSMITIATVGYGDISPVTDSARLLSAFFSICGQFYIVTLVGIIISKFSSKQL